jgi:N-acetylmuramoyl-L-alanine amidase-like protein
VSPARRVLVLLLTAAFVAAILLALTLQPPQASAASPRVFAAPHSVRPALDASDAPKPHIVWKRIPFGTKRRNQMAAYSKRHYGVAAWKLTGPKVIVEHFTGGTSFSAAWNTFASNEKHLGESPGTCPHFMIDTDGTIYQLVPLWIRCRHAMGMNWTAFGIEHVGRSDAAVMGDAKEIASSYALTLWLVQQYHLQVRNVIGHAETLESPYHVERVAADRCQTHSDFSRADMRTYRSRLKQLAYRHHVPVGPPPAWVDSGC